METVQKLTGTTEAIPQVQPTAERSPTQQTAERTRRPRLTVYDKIGMTIAYLFSLAAAAVLWWIGARFTLVAFGGFFGTSLTLLLWWLIPIGITAIEIWLMPRRGARWQIVSIFLVILLVDVCSSWYGTTATLGGRFVPLGTRFTVPTGGAVLHSFAIVAGIILAFIPEKLARWAASELWKLWR